MSNYITKKILCQYSEGRIQNGQYDIEELPNGMFNIFDLQTCIELFTPIYQIFLSDSDFWLSVQSLQLDETIAIYPNRA